MADPVYEDIRSGSIRRIYLLYGEENYLKDYYCSQLRKKLIAPEDEMNLHVWDGLELDMKTLEDEVMTIPFFAEHRLIIVRRSGLFKKNFNKKDPGDLRKPSQIREDAQALAKMLPNVPEQTVLVFLENEIDRGSAAYHAAQKAGARVVEYRYTTGDRLVRWVVGGFARKGRQIQKSAMDLFMERTGGKDMYLLAGEIEKLVAYTEGRNGILLEDVQAVTSVTAEYQIFQLTEAIARRDQDTALKIYRDMLQQKQSPIGIVAMIYTQFNRIMQMRDLREQGRDTDTIAQRLNIPPNRKFTISRSLNSVSSFTMEQLRRMIRLCGQANQDIVSGRMEPKLAAELLITLCISQTAQDIS